MRSGDVTAGAFALHRKTRVTAELVFETAWRIGSGREGESSDLGVMLNPSGSPVLPGSSLKGRLRSTCETLAHALNLKACLLSSEASGVNCTSDVNYYRTVREEYRRASQESVERRLRWIGEHTCDVCKLFGSPVQAGRLRVSDGALKDWASVVQVRDGVVIDRDSQTAVDGLKYDYEVIPSGSRFALCIDLDSPRDQDLALLGAALFEWCSGSSIGGFTSRGLGRFHLREIKASGVDLSDPEQRVRFLTSTKADDRLSDLGDWESFFGDRIQRRLQPAPSEEG